MAVVQILALSVDAKGTIAKNRIGTTIKEEYRIVDDYFYNNVPGFLNSITANSPIYDDADGHAVQRSLELGAPHPGSSNAVLKSISAKRSGNDKQAGGPFVWNVTLEYAPEDDVDKKDTDCKISISVETNDETDGRYDVEYNLNVNTLGDFFEDKLPLKNKILVIRFQKNFGTNPCGQAANNAGIALQTIMNCVNSQTMWELAPGTVLIRSYSCDRNKDNDGRYYWATSIEMAFNPEGWTLKKANCGFYDRNGRILDEEGAPVEKAKLLDKKGNVIDPLTSEPEMLKFRLYKEAPLHAINIPNPFEDNPGQGNNANTPNNGE